MKRVSLKTSPQISRGNGWSMDPKDIYVFPEENPRKKYPEEKYQLLKANIKATGYLTDDIIITPYITPDGKEGWKCCHGFTRMRAINELREEGFVIERVPVDANYNEEEILWDHFRRNNTGVEMDDVDLAEMFRRIQKMTQNDNISYLVEKTGLPDYKIRTMLGFAETAGTVLKEAVRNDEVSFTTAVQIAANSTGIEHQNAIISEGKKEAEKQGKKRITNTIVDNQIGRVKINKELDKLRTALCMNGNYSEVVHVIDNIGMEMSELLSILKQEVES